LKRFLFAVVTLVVALALVEIGARVALRAIPAPMPARVNGEGKRAERLHAERLGVFAGIHVLHPFLGFVEDPAEQRRTRGPSDMAELGFYSGPLVRKRDPSTYVVGVFGGSVAAGFADEHGPEVAFADVAAGRKVVALNTAIGGYKQPQQLIALAYLLTLGAQFDAVLLIDGFNDVALAPAENMTRGVSPIYPRSWGLLVADLEANRGVRDVLAQLGLIADARRALADWHPRLGVAVLAGRLADRAAAAREAALRNQLRVERIAAGNGFQATGPVLDGGARALADYWRRASLSMRALAEENGARFVHVLQPNQYGAPRPMSDAEQAVAYEPAHPYAKPARDGYPLLREAGRELAAAGVEFHDLSDVFAGVREPIYVDSCCHFYGRGNILLAEELRRRLTTSPEPTVRTKAARRGSERRAAQLDRP
jgi:hypothetical protein